MIPASPLNGRWDVPRHGSIRSSSRLISIMLLPWGIPVGAPHLQGHAPAPRWPEPGPRTGRFQGRAPQSRAQPHAATRHYPWLPLRWATQRRKPFTGAGTCWRKCSRRVRPTSTRWCPIFFSARLDAKYPSLPHGTGLYRLAFADWVTRHQMHQNEPSLAATK